MVLKWRPAAKPVPRRRAAAASPAARSLQRLHCLHSQAPIPRTAAARHPMNSNEPTRCNARSSTDCPGSVGGGRAWAATGSVRRPSAEASGACAPPPPPLRDPHDPPGGSRRRPNPRACMWPAWGGCARRGGSALGMLPPCLNSSTCSRRSIGSHSSLALPLRSPPAPAAAALAGVLQPTACATRRAPPPPRHSGP